ncbi:MAG: acyltransferase [Terriglobales bacterium]|jgi:peptidoglycan/LPS O-acetylase OafA/YrhL
MAVAEMATEQRIQTARTFDFRKRLPALDGLRGLAILAVFFYHYAGGVGAHTTSSAVRALSVVFALGWSGVDLFFVLSGFLITGILYDTQNDPEYYRNFYARRVLRIFPIYYLLVVIYLCLGLFLGAQWKPAHLFFLVYLGYPAALIWPSLTAAVPSLAVTHLWSLSVEEQFYMAWPWLVAKLRTRRAILLGCLVVAILALALRVCIWASGWNPDWATGFLFCRMDQLALGAAISILIRGSLYERILRWAPVLAVCATAPVIAMFFVRHTVDRSDPVLWTIGYTLIASSYGTLLLLCLRPCSWVQALFSWSIWRTFGKYSYGLYLYHFPLAALLSPMRENFVTRLHSFWVGSTLYMLACLAVNLFIAAASFHFFESPIMGLKGRFSYTSENR